MNERPRWSHEVVLAAQPASAATARVFVATHLVRHELVGLVEDVRLVASELATNALTHARTSFAVALSATDGSVLLAVRDSSMSMPVMMVARGMDLGGRGLTIVAVLSHAWGVATDERGHKSVWASFAIPPQIRDLAAPPATVDTSPTAAMRTRVANSEGQPSVLGHVTADADRERG